MYHDGQWGNVCDDLFRSDDADVACLSLNYTDGAICYANSPFPPSSGLFDTVIVSASSLLYKSVAMHQSIIGT